MRRQEREIMGLDVLSSISFIDTAGDSVMIRFPRKNVFLFQPPTRSRREIEDPKGWKFKRF
jgi:hypothetical protein